MLFHSQMQQVDLGKAHLRAGGALMSRVGRGTCQSLDDTVSGLESLCFHFLGLASSTEHSTVSHQAEHERPS